MGYRALQIVLWGYLHSKDSKLQRCMQQSWGRPAPACRAAVDRRATGNHSGRCSERPNNYFAFLTSKNQTSHRVSLELRQALHLHRVL